MSEKEKLQKAIEATIVAGYQLNSEAFEFLSKNSDTTDPVGIINLALQKLSDLQEKPFFIDKAFLETLVQQLTVPTKETQPQQRQNTVEPPTQQISTIESTFYPYAKDIKANI